MLVAGPIVGSIIGAVRSLQGPARPSVWLLSELPLANVPGEFLSDLQRSAHLIVVEEHVAQGKVGQAISHHLLSTTFNFATCGPIHAPMGPILVLGASGFVGANLLRSILQFRDDSYGVATRLPAWRLEGLPRDNVRVMDLLVGSNLGDLL